MLRSSARRASSQAFSDRRGGPRVLAGRLDLRPKAAAIRRYVERFSRDAADDVPALPVTASWHQQYVLVQVRTVLDGPLIDLCDADVRYEVELEHAALLDTHGMDHLDLSQITADKRPVTQTIAADLHDRLGAAGIRFP